MVSKLHSNNNAMVLVMPMEENHSSLLMRIRYSLLACVYGDVKFGGGGVNIQPERARRSGEQTEFPTVLSGILHE